MNLTNLVDAMGLVFQQQLQCDILLVKFHEGVAYLIVTEIETGNRFRMALAELSNPVELRLESVV